MKIHVFYGNLDDQDHEYVGDKEEYIDEVCGKEQGDFVWCAENIMVFQKGRVDSLYIDLSSQVLSS